jgi:hypothetical protein
MDIFTWSIPFVAEKITDMLYHVVKVNENEDFSDDEDPNIPGNGKAVVSGDKKAELSKSNII